MALGVVAALVLAATTFAASVTPKPGRYSGHVESVFAIGFTVSANDKRITALQTDFQAPCGVIAPNKVVTKFPTIAIHNGRFRGSKPNREGAYRITGRFSAPGAASGTVSGQEKLIGFTKKPNSANSPSRSRPHASASELTRRAERASVVAFAVPTPTAVGSPAEDRSDLDSDR